MWRAFLWLFLLAAICAPRESRAATDPHYQKGLELYEKGEYALAAKELHELLYPPPSGFDPEKLVRAHLYRGISLFLIEDKEQADKEFWQVLLTDPEFKPDPLFTPAAVIAAFDRIRRDNAAELKKIRRLARRQPEVPPDPFGPVGVGIRGEFLRSIAPFGLAQFHNKQPGKAYAVLGAETTLVVANVSTAVAFYSLQKQGNRFNRDEVNDARLAKSVNNVSFFLLLGTLFYGSADGIWNATRARPPPPSDRPVITPGPGTAGLSLTWRF